MPELPPPPPPRPKGKSEDVYTRPQFTPKAPESPFGGEIAGPITGAGTGEIAMPVSTPQGEAQAADDRSVGNSAYAVAQWVKESMWNYENRPRGRSAQAHLGPSEIGSVCDRKLVFKLKGFKPVAHGGGPKWPAIVGTGVHTWMEGMSQWLDSDRGRFLIEHHVTIIKDELEGTLDLYDRMNKRVIDWKAPSARAVRKYKLEGAGAQYRTQGQLYALGLAMQGEDPREIAIVFMARDAASIDQGIHVETFPYKPSEAHAAVDKYKRLRDLALNVESALEVDATPTNLCSYCPFFAPGVAGSCDGTTRKVAS